MKLLALTFGNETCASTQYRIIQYRPLMEAAGITLEHAPAKTFSNWASLPNYDVVILQKTLLNRRKIRRLAKGARRLLYDSDDRIWMRPGKPYGWLTAFRIKMRLKLICRLADQCIAANGIIADDLQQHGATPVIIPMALDGNIWFPPEKREGPLTIGWTGSPASLQYLEPIRPAITAVQRTHPEVRWQIHCGRDPEWKDLNYEHIPYTPGNEPETVRGFDIGLLPLPDGEFAQGKSPIKALQYFASGVALIHSPVGATIELTRNNTLGLPATQSKEWNAMMNQLIHDQGARSAMTGNASGQFDSQHEMRSVFTRLKIHLSGAK